MREPSANEEACAEGAPSPPCPVGSAADALPFGQSAPKTEAFLLEHRACHPSDPALAPVSKTRCAAAVCHLAGRTASTPCFGPKAENASAKPQRRANFSPDEARKRPLAGGFAPRASKLDGRERSAGPPPPRSFSLLTRRSGTSARDARRIRHPPPPSIRSDPRSAGPDHHRQDHRQDHRAQGETAAARSIFAAFLGPRGSQVPRRCHAPAGGNSRPAVSLPHSQAAARLAWRSASVPSARRQAFCTGRRSFTRPFIPLLCGLRKDQRAAPAARKRRP